MLGALKERGVSRKHRCFTSCYKRLFNLSKSFLKVSVLLSGKNNCFNCYVIKFIKIIKRDDFTL